MKLPTRVQGHEFHPEGVYEMTFGGVPTVWCISATKYRQGLPLLAKTDHWYADADGPHVFETAKAADKLVIKDLASGGVFESVAKILHQAYGPFLFTSPDRVPKSKFGPLTSVLMNPGAQKAFVATASSGTLDNQGSVDRLALMVLAGQSGKPQDFGVAWIVPGKPKPTKISFGPKILAPLRFASVEPSSKNHPANWKDGNGAKNAFAYVIP
ncbi:MAG: hypothetical protein AAGH15_18630 [Myxococcota bacterium]